MNTDCQSSPLRECDDRDELGSSAEGDVPPERTDRPAPHTMELSLDRGPLTADRGTLLEQRLRAVASLLPRPVARINVRIVQDGDMATLHQQWHDAPTTTDVMTFEHADEGPLEVDLVLCSDQADREADGRPHAADEELLLYAVHGLLHCCGFDDHTEAEASAMHAEEDRLLKQIGLGPIFASREDDR
ncbi:MAG: rRNA maturation RNase YbeY [Phycisphaerales bacterium]|jgi:probable rRNA maturation factor|nr:rRNA maturation RNase YbeY [Phycisphaerales bacterium]